MNEQRNTDLLKIIQEKQSTFSKGQKQISSFILGHYDKAAYMTAAKLGALVGVSESTVVRFANELGFAGYPEHDPLEAHDNPENRNHERPHRRVRPARKSPVLRHRQNQAHTRRNRPDKLRERRRRPHRGADDLHHRNALVLVARVVYVSLSEPRLPARQAREDDKRLRNLRAAAQDKRQGRHRRHQRSATRRSRARRSSR